MLVKAYKDGANYILPISGKSNVIEIMIDEDKYDFDWLKYMQLNLKEHQELTKKEYKDLRGDDLWRKEMMMDKITMKQHWQELVMTHDNPYIDDDDKIEEAHANWNID